jgi:hypothetical protein
MRLLNKVKALSIMTGSRKKKGWMMYKFDVLAIARVVVRVALHKYEIVSTGNHVLRKLILCLN